MSFSKKTLYQLLAIIGLTSSIFAHDKKESYDTNDMTQQEIINRGVQVQQSARINNLFSQLKGSNQTIAGLLSSDLAIYNMLLRGNVDRLLIIDSDVTITPTSFAAAESDKVLAIAPQSDPIILSAKGTFTNINDITSPPPVDNNLITNPNSSVNGPDDTLIINGALNASDDVNVLGNLVVNGQFSFTPTDPTKVLTVQGDLILNGQCESSFVNSGIIRVNGAITIKDYVSTTGDAVTNTGTIESLATGCDGTIMFVNNNAPAGIAVRNNGGSITSPGHIIFERNRGTVSVCNEVAGTITVSGAGHLFFTDNQATDVAIKNNGTTSVISATLGDVIFEKNKGTNQAVYNLAEAQISAASCGTLLLKDNTSDGMAIQNNNATITTEQGNIIIEGNKGADCAFVNMAAGKLQSTGGSMPTTDSGSIYIKDNYSKNAIAISNIGGTVGDPSTISITTGDIIIEGNRGATAGVSNATNGLIAVTTMGSILFKENHSFSTVGNLSGVINDDSAKIQATTSGCIIFEKNSGHTYGVLNRNSSEITAYDNVIFNGNKGAMSDGVRNDQGSIATPTVSEKAFIVFKYNIGRDYGVRNESTGAGTSQIITQNTTLFSGTPAPPPPAGNKTKILFIGNSGSLHDTYNHNGGGLANIIAGPNPALIGNGAICYDSQRIPFVNSGTVSPGALICGKDHALENPVIENLNVDSSVTKTIVFYTDVTTQLDGSSDVTLVLADNNNLDVLAQVTDKAVITTEGAIPNTMITPANYPSLDLLTHALAEVIIEADVVVTDGSNLTVNEDLTIIGDLAIRGGSLTVAAGKQLTVTGNLIADGLQGDKTFAIQDNTSRVEANNISIRGYHSTSSESVFVSGTLEAVCGDIIIQDNYGVLVKKDSVSADGKVTATGKITFKNNINIAANGSAVVVTGAVESIGSSIQVIGNRGNGSGHGLNIAKDAALPNAIAGSLKSLTDIIVRSNSSDVDPTSSTAGDGSGNAVNIQDDATVMALDITFKNNLAVGKKLNTVLGTRIIACHSIIFDEDTTSDGVNGVLTGHVYVCGDLIVENNDLNIIEGLNVHGGSLTIDGFALNVIGDAIFDGRQDATKSVNVATGSLNARNITIKNYTPTTTDVPVTIAAPVTAQHGTVTIMHNDATGSSDTDKTAVSATAEIKASRNVFVTYNAGKGAGHGVAVSGAAGKLTSTGGTVSTSNNSSTGTGHGVHLEGTIATGVVQAHKDIIAEGNSSTSGNGLNVPASATVVAGGDISTRGNIGGTDDVSVGGTVQSAGPKVFDGDVTVTTDFGKAGAVQSNVVINGNLTVDEAITFDRDVTVLGDLTVTTGNALTVQGNLTVRGSVTISDALVSQGDILFDGLNQSGSSVIVNTGGSISGRNITIQNYNSTVSSAVRFEDTVTANHGEIRIVHNTAPSGFLGAEIVGAVKASGDIVIANNASSAGVASGVIVSGTTGKITSTNGSVHFRDNQITGTSTGSAVDLSSSVADGIIVAHKDVTFTGNGNNPGGVTAIYGLDIPVIGLAIRSATGEVSFENNRGTLDNLRILGEINAHSLISFGQDTTVSTDLLKGASGQLISRDVTVNGDFTIDESVTIDGNLNVYGSVTIAAGQTLTVIGDILFDGQGKDKQVAITGNLVGHTIVMKNYQATTSTNLAVAITGTVTASDSITIRDNKGADGTAAAGAIAVSITNTMTAKSTIRMINNIGGDGANNAGTGFNGATAISMSGSLIANKVLLESNTGGNGGDTTITMAAGGFGGQAISLTGAVTAYGSAIISNNIGGNTGLSEDNAGRIGADAVAIQSSIDASTIIIRNNTGGTGGQGDLIGGGTVDRAGGIAVNISSTSELHAKSNIVITDNTGGIGGVSDNAGVVAGVGGAAVVIADTASLMADADITIRDNTGGVGGANTPGGTKGDGGIAVVVTSTTNPAIQANGGLVISDNIGGAVSGGAGVGGTAGIDIQNTSILQGRNPIVFDQDVVVSNDFNNTGTVTGNVIVNGNLTIDQPLTIDGNLTVHGDVTLSGTGSLTVNDNLTIFGSANISIPALVTVTNNVILDGQNGATASVNFVTGSNLSASDVTIRNYQPTTSGTVGVNLEGIIDIDNLSIVNNAGADGTAAVGSVAVNLAGSMTVKGDVFITTNVGGDGNGDTAGVGNAGGEAVAIAGTLTVGKELAIIDNLSGITAASTGTAAGGTGADAVNITGAITATNITLRENCGSDGTAGSGTDQNGGAGGHGVNFAHTAATTIRAYADMVVINNEGGDGGNGTATNSAGGNAGHAVLVGANTTIVVDANATARDNQGGAGGNGAGTGTNGNGGNGLSIVGTVKVNDRLVLGDNNSGGAAGAGGAVAGTPGKDLDVSGMLETPDHTVVFDQDVTVSTDFGVSGTVTSDVIVNGNLTIDQPLTIDGNLTVHGDVTLSGTGSLTVNDNLTIFGSANISIPALVTVTNNVILDGQNGATASVNFVTGSNLSASDVTIRNYQPTTSGTVGVNLAGMIDIDNLSIVNNAGADGTAAVGSVAVNLAGSMTVKGDVFITTNVGGDGNGDTAGVGNAGGEAVVIAGTLTVGKELAIIDNLSGITAASTGTAVGGTGVDAVRLTGAITATNITLRENCGGDGTAGSGTDQNGGTGGHGVNFDHAAATTIRAYADMVMINNEGGDGGNGTTDNSNGGNAGHAVLVGANTTIVVDANATVRDNQGGDGGDGDGTGTNGNGGNGLSIVGTVKVNDRLVLESNSGGAAGTGVAGAGAPGKNFDGSNTVIGDVIVNGNVTVDQDLTIDDNLTVHGNLTLSGTATLTVNKDLTVFGSVNIPASTIVTVKNDILFDGQEENRTVSIAGNIVGANFGSDPTDPGVNNVIIRNYSPAGTSPAVSITSSVVALGSVLFENNRGNGTDVINASVYLNTVSTLTAPLIDAGNGISFKDNEGVGYGITVRGNSAHTTANSVPVIRAVSGDIIFTGNKSIGATQSSGVIITFDTNNAFTAVQTLAGNIVFSNNKGSDFVGAAQHGILVSPADNSAEYYMIESRGGSTSFMYNEGGSGRDEAGNGVKFSGIPVDGKYVLSDRDIDFVGNLGGSITIAPGDDAAAGVLLDDGRILAGRDITFAKNSGGVGGISLGNGGNGGDGVLVSGNMSITANNDISFIDNVGGVGRDAVTPSTANGGVGGTAVNIVNNATTLLTAYHDVIFKGNVGGNGGNGGDSPNVSNLNGFGGNGGNCIFIGADITATGNLYMVENQSGNGGNSGTTNPSAGGAPAGIGGTVITIAPTRTVTAHVHAVLENNLAGDGGDAVAGDDNGDGGFGILIQGSLINGQGIYIKGNRGGAPGTGAGNSAGHDYALLIEPTPSGDAILSSEQSIIFADDVSLPNPILVNNLTTLLITGPGVLSGLLKGNVVFSQDLSVESDLFVHGNVEAKGSVTVSTGATLTSTEDIVFDGQQEAKEVEIIGTVDAYNVTIKDYRSTIDHAVDVSGTVTARHNLLFRNNRTSAGSRNGVNIIGNVTAHDDLRFKYNQGPGATNNGSTFGVRANGATITTSDIFIVTDCSSANQDFDIDGGSITDFYGATATIHVNDSGTTACQIDFTP